MSNERRPLQRLAIGLGLLVGAFWLGIRFEASRSNTEISKPFSNAEEFLAALDEAHPFGDDYKVYRRLELQSGGITPDLRDSHNVPLLSRLILEDRKEAFRRVVALGPYDSMAKDDKGQTPLHYAAAHRDAWFYLSALGQNLMDSGEYKDAKGQTPLHLAAERDDMAAVLLLSTDRMNTNIVDKEGNGPLHLAIIGSKDQSIGSVVTLARDPSQLVADAQGRTPLLLATDLEKWPIVRVLSENGDDPNMPDLRGRTARAEIQRKNEKLYRELVPTWRQNGFPTDHDSKGRTPMMQAVDAGDWHRVELLSSAGADPNAIDARGRTPRQEIEKRNPALYKALLDVWDKNCYNTAWKERMAREEAKTAGPILMRSPHQANN